MIKKILTILMSLIFGSVAAAQEVSEESFFVIKDMKNISFKLSIVFSPKRILTFKSNDTDWISKLKEIPSDELRHIKEYRWSMSTSDGYLTKPIFLNVQVEDISEYLRAIISSTILADYGQRTLSTLSKNFKLGIRHLGEGKIIFYNERDSHAKVFKKSEAYRSDREYFFEQFVDFVERVDTLMSKIEKSEKGDDVKETTLNTLQNHKNESIESLQNSLLNIASTSYLTRTRMDNKKLQEIPVLDEILNSKISELNEETLLHLITISFSIENANQSFVFTSLIIKEAIKRQSVRLQTAIADAFMNSQACFLMGECQVATPISMILVNKYFYDFDEAVLAKLLLGINLRLSREVYYEDTINELFYAYFEMTDNPELSQRIIRRFRSFMSDLVKDQLSDDAFYKMIEKLTVNPKNKEIQKDLEMLRTDFDEMWKDYHGETYLKIHDKPNLPAGIKKLIPITNIKYEVTFKREGKEDLTLDASSERAWGFYKDSSRRDEELNKKINSGELMFPKEVTFSMCLDDITFAKEVRVKDFFNFFRSFDSADLTVNSTRHVLTLDPAFSLGLSKIFEDTIIIYNAKENAEVAYRIDKDKFPNLRNELDFLRHQLMQNSDGKLYDNSPDKKKIFAIFENYKNEKLESIEKAILSIIYIENTFSEFLKRPEIKGERDSIAPFDTMVEANISKFSPETMTHLIDLSFFNDNASNNYAFSFLLAEEIIKRKSLPLQAAFAEAFLSTQSGPTSVGTNLIFHDALINEYFPRFEEDVIVTLILAATKWNMSINADKNDIGHLFFAYLTDAKDLEQAKKVIGKFKAYAFEEMHKYYDEHMDYKDYKVPEVEEFWHGQHIYRLVKKLGENKNSEVASPLVDTLKGDLLEAWEEIKRSDIRATRKLLNRMIHKMDKDELSSIQFSSEVLRQNGRSIDYRKIDFDLFYELLQKLITDNYGGYEGIKHGLFDLLAEYDAKRLEDRLIVDIKRSSRFKRNTFELFSWFEEIDNDKREYLHDLMAIVKAVYAGKSREFALKEQAEKRRLNEIKKREEAKKWESSALRTEYNKAYKKQIPLEDFLNYTKKLAEKSQHVKEYAFRFADYTTKIMIQNIKENDFVNAKKIFYHYINNLLPLAGDDRKSTDVASNGLVLGLLSKDEALNHTIFDKLLGSDFQIHSIDNEILLFNIACYYATHNDKKKLLPAIRQALFLGKPVESFLSDSDFKAYWEDEDFKALMNTTKLDKEKR